MTYAPGFLEKSDLDTMFFNALSNIVERPWWTSIATLSPSDKSTEEYGWLGNVPQMTEWTNGRDISELNKYTLTIRNKRFQSGIGLDRSDLRRDKTGQIMARIGELAVRGLTFANELVATLITNGEAGTSGLAYDGQYYFDTDHDESGTSQTNDLTATEVPAANVSDTDKPTATECADIITQVVSHAMFFTDDQREPVNTTPGNWQIHVGNAIYKAALENAIAQFNLTGSVTNPVAGLISSGYRFTVVANPRLSSTADKLYFFRADSGPVKPFIVQEEEGITSQMIGAGSELETMLDRHFYGITWRGNAGYGRWQDGILVTLS